jgi:flagellar L-ring protein precursor FlgH
MHYLRLHALGFVAVTLCMTSCVSKHPPRDDDSDGLKWAQAPLPATTNGSVYHTGRELALFENPVARRVGDTVTIVLNESTSAQKSQVTTTTKNTTATLPGPTLLGKPVTIHGNPILSAGLNDSTKFDGEGASSQSNTLTGDVTVTVMKVLPNGNLYVRGQKWIAINQGKEYVQLAGVVRTIDIAPDNTVSSSQVANATISYGAKGALADVNAQGWLSRFFNSPWMPF